MSASPQKQRSSSSSKQKLIPEVVIYTDRQPRSGLSKPSQPSSGSQRKGSTTTRTTTIAVGNSDAMTMKQETEQQQDDAAFAGLTRIEQIRLRARLKAEEEDRKLEQAEAKKAAAASAAEAQRRAKNGVTGRDKAGRSISDEYKDVDSDDDDEDDEELADVIIRSRPSMDGTGQQSSSPLSSAPTPLFTPLSSVIVTPSSFEQRQETSSSPLLDDGDEDNDDTLMMDPSPSYSTSRSASQGSTSIAPAPAATSSASQRTRRSTARVEPYVFRPSLEPLSQRRKQLLVAKQSAAVQAKLIEKGQFRSGPTSSLSTEKGADLMEKAFRDHRRDKRKGMDSKSLMRTVQMAQAGMIRLRETAESEEKEGAGAGEEALMVGEEDEGEALNDDTSSNSSSSSSSGEAEAMRKDVEKAEVSAKRVKFAYTSPKKEREAERRRFAHLLGNASDDEDGAEVFDILQRDREGMKRARNRQLGDSLADTQWSVWKKGRPEIHLEPFPQDALTKSVTNDALIASLLDSHLLLGDVKDSRSLTNWILRSAVLAPTGELAHSSVRLLLKSLRGSNSTVLRKVVLEELPALLLELGSKEEIVSFCFLERKGGASTSMPVSGPLGRVGRKTQMRRGDRHRAAGRVIQILEAVVASMETGEIDEFEHSTLIALFLYALHLGVDQSLERFAVQVSRLLTAALNLIHRGASSIDVVNLLLTGKIVSMLKEEPPSIRAIILDRIPSLTIPSRSLQRSIAYRALLLSTSDAKETGDNSSKKSNDEVKIDLGRLSDILESRDGSINPVLATKTRDYLSIDANLNILCFVFNDLALQLFEHDYKQEQDGHESKEDMRKAGPVLLRVVSAYHHTQQQQQQQQTQQDGGDRRRKGQADGVLTTTTTNNDHDDNNNNNRVSVAKIEAIQKIIKSLHSIAGRIQDGKGAFLDRSKAKDHLQRLHLMLTYELSYFGLVGEGGRINGGDNNNNNQGRHHHHHQQHLFSNSMKQKSLSSFLQKV